MELRHLRYFCAPAEHGTFSEAGRQLHVSQSGIGEQIADLDVSSVALVSTAPRASPRHPPGFLLSRLRMDYVGQMSMKQAFQECGLSPSKKRPVPCVHLLGTGLFDAR